MNTNKERILIDADETTARTIEDWVYPIVNAEYWTNLSFNTTLNCRDVFWSLIQENWVPITLEKKIKIFKSAIAQDIWKNQIRTVAWSVEKILELSEWYQLDILTARHPDLIEYTTNWTQYKYNWAIAKVFSSNCYYGWKVSKSDICKNEGVKMMIEDDMDYALELAKEWIKVYLLKKPWNVQRPEKHRNIVKVDWWNEIKI